MKFFLFIIVLFLCVNSALGCSLMGYPDPPLGYIISKFETIYIGSVVSIKTTIEKDEDGDRYRLKRMKLKAERTLKGAAQEFQEVATYEELVKTSCSETPTEFKIGEKWIIHQGFDRGTENRRNELGFTFNPFRGYDAGTSIEYLAEIEKYVKNPVTAIYGQMETRLGSQLFKEVEVFLEGNGIKASAKLDNDGRYAFENIPAGDYRIQIRYPSQMTDVYHNRKAVYDSATKTFNIEYEATVKPGGSDYYYIVYAS